MEYEISFKPIYLNADSSDDADKKAVEQVRLGNLEVNQLNRYFDL